MAVDIILTGVGGNIVTEGLRRITTGVRQAIQAARHNHDLEQAVVAALERAARQGARDIGSLEQQRLWKALLREAPSHVTTTRPSPILDALLLGDNAQIHAALAQFADPHITREAPDRRSDTEDRLTRLFLEQFAEVLKEPGHARAWNAFQREVLDGTRRDLRVLLDRPSGSPEVGEADRRNIEACLERIEGFVSKRVPLPNLSERFAAISTEVWEAAEVVVDHVTAEVERGTDQVRTHVEGVVERGVGRVIEEIHAARTVQPEAPVTPEHVWFVPHQRNPHFTGREAALADLRAALTSGGRAALTQAISGLGGVGKSQTALEYAFRHRDDYAYVFWARADTDAALTADYAEIARRLNLPEQAAQESEVVREAVKAWLGDHGGYLLVLDNADTPEVVKPFLPSGPQGHVFLTSRVRHLTALGVHRAVSLDEMTPEEAREFLLGRVTWLGDRASSPAVQQAADALAGALGYLPLALEQAAAYCEHEQRSFHAYLADYEKQRLALLEKYGPVTGDYPETVRTTWTKSIDAVRRQKPASVDLLTVSAFWAPERIPLELLCLGAPELGDTVVATLAGTAEYEARRYTALGELLTPLAEYSLITRDPDDETYDLHRLVQEAVRAALPDDEQRRAWAEQAVRAANRAFPTLDPENWPLCDRLAPHAVACATWIETYDLKSKAAARMLDRVGVYLYCRDKYAEVEPLLQRALAIREAVLGPLHWLTFSSLKHLAALHESQGRLAEAEMLYERVLAIVEAVLEPQDPAMVSSLDDLAELYLKQGRLAEAAALYERELTIVEAVDGSDHPSVASVLCNLAHLYWSQGRLAEAAALYERALAIHEGVLGEKPLDAQIVREHLARLRAQLGGRDP